jgi:hypothetical protein
MTFSEFAYWMQGFFEMTEANNLTEAQVQMIKDHLKLVFNPVVANSKLINHNNLYCHKDKIHVTLGNFPPTIDDIDQALKGPQVVYMPQGSC